MSARADPVLSALVVLAAADPQKTVGPTEPGGLVDIPPDPATADRVRAHFDAEGFEVSEVVASSFSITGPRSLFLRCLGPSEAPDSALRGAREGLALPLGSLPGPVADAVQVVTFTPPPDFGPGNP